MIFDNEDQRAIILQALLKVPIQADFEGLSDYFPKMQALVEAVKGAKVEELKDGKGE